MNLIPFIMLYLVASSSGSSCLASSEDYATEVVIPFYDEFKLVGLPREGDTHIFTSQYSPSLLTLAKETDIPKGLSIRLQVPTKTETKEQPHLRFIATSSKSLREITVNQFSGWTLHCQSQKCNFEKTFLSVEANRIQGGTEVTVEITKPLELCSSRCPGICLASHTKQYCIDLALKQDLDSILRYANISDNLPSILGDYHPVGSESVTLINLAPTETTSVDWTEAMRQELVYLRNQGIISIDREDIEQIAQLAKRGQAGQNYRLVHDQSQWKTYDKSQDAVLTSERDCQEYTLPSTTAQVTQSPDLFYIIPIIITSASLLLLVTLIIVARLITKSQSKARKI